MKKILSALLVLLSLTVSAQRTDPHLQKEIAQLLTGFNGDMGVYVYDINRNKVAEVNAEYCTSNGDGKSSDFDRGHAQNIQWRIILSPTNDVY